MTVAALRPGDEPLLRIVPKTFCIHGQLAVLVCGLILMTECSRPGSHNASMLISAKERRRAPDFVVRNDSGGEETVEVAKYRGQVLILFVFRSSCAPCREEANWLKALSATLNGKGLVVLGISLGTLVTPDEVRFQHVIADERFSYAFGGIRRVPMTIVVDREGNIAFSASGSIATTILDSAVKNLL